MATAAIQRPDQPWKEDLAVKVICPECKEDPPNLNNYDQFETICDSCGMVLLDREIDQHSEWRTFNNDDSNNDDPSRVGQAANYLLTGDQLATGIAFASGFKNGQLRNTQTKMSNNKNNLMLKAAYNKIESLCDTLNVPRVTVELIKYLYKVQDEAKLFKGKAPNPLKDDVPNPVYAGCIFVGLRQSEYPRTFREVQDHTGVTKKELGRTFKALNTYFQGLNLIKNDESEMTEAAVKNLENYTSGRGTDPASLATRFCNQLELPYAIANICASLCEKVAASGDLAGRSPNSVIGACIYMASHLMGEGRTAKQIGPIAGVSDGTIKSAYKQLFANKEKYIEQTWLVDGKKDGKKDLKGDAGRVLKGDISRLPSS